MSPHQVDVTQAVEPEGVDAGGDHVQLVGLEGLFTLQHGAVQPGADPLVHPAQGSGLQ